jgi:hypothetical protein
MSEQAKHTPGPWCVVRDVSKEWDVYSGSRFQNASKYICTTQSRFAKGKANAALIAAAPDLLEALKSIATQITGDPRARYFFGEELRAQADAAIAKAEGVAE